jgi:hypothetical protein
MQTNHSRIQVIRSFDYVKSTREPVNGTRVRVSRIHIEVSSTRLWFSQRREFVTSRRVWVSKTRLGFIRLRLDVRKCPVFLVKPPPRPADANRNAVFRRNGSIDSTARFSSKEITHDPAERFSAGAVLHEFQ